VDNHVDGRTSSTGEPVTTPASARSAEASVFSVLLLNDDHTPAEFVVSVLEAVFGKTREDAFAVMLEIHGAGRGVCGAYTREEAAAKVERVADLARRNGHPLSCAMEPGPSAQPPRPDQSGHREVSLFDPARHVPLPRPEEGWDPGVAHAAVREIAEDALARCDPERFWPAHPLDDGLREGATSLYFGATGVVWALDHLQRSGAARIGADFAPVLGRLLAANRAKFARGPYPGHASWLMGDVAVLALAMRLAPEGATADALHARCAANADLPALELMWGMPGSMLACLLAHRMTGGTEGRWRELYRHQAERLLAGLEETADGPLWTQELYGQRARYLGPVHGFAGNMLPLLRGWDWLGPAQQARVAEAVPRTLAATA
jgi:ATP-dependent Clp protease adapter protein ClpS